VCATCVMGTFFFGDERDGTLDLRLHHFDHQQIINQSLDTNHTVYYSLRFKILVVVLAQISKWRDNIFYDIHYMANIVRAAYIKSSLVTG
jgi:hypothetical protein